MGRNALSVGIKHTPLFPARKVLNGMLYYGHQIELTAAAGAPNTDFFYVNGLFDPDVSGTGHQPMGFDQMMLFYEHYAVLRATITVTGVGNTSGDLVRFGIYLSPDAVALTDPRQIIENGLVNTKLSEAKEVPKSKTVSLSCDVAKYFGKRSWQDILDDEKLTGTSVADPVEGVYFAIVGWCATSAVTWSLKYDVCISFDACFFEPRKVGIS